MNQDKINGQAEEKKSVSYAEIAAIMNEELTDDNLKELLFEMTTIRPSGITGIGVIYKMLMFSFIFALSKYRADKRNGRDVESTPNARRAMETMDCLYNGEDMSLDIIIYVLTEMQLDVASADKRAYFDGIFSRDDDAIQIPVFRSVIKTWLSSADYAESNERVLAGYLFGLYKAIPALKDIELRIKDMTISDPSAALLSYTFDLDSCHYSSTSLVCHPDILYSGAFPISSIPCLPLALNPTEHLSSSSVSPSPNADFR